MLDTEAIDVSLANTLDGAHIFWFVCEPNDALLTCWRRLSVLKAEIIILEKSPAARIAPSAGPIQEVGLN